MIPDQVDDTSIAKMLHALGMTWREAVLNKPTAAVLRQQYRNSYRTGPRDPDWCWLRDHGLAREFANASMLFGGQSQFSVTEAGMDLISARFAGGFDEPL